MPSQIDIEQFAVYDETGILLYKKYNFNFDKYMDDFKIDKSTDKNTVFYDFIIKNGNTVDKPFVIKDEYKKYFIKMRFQQSLNDIYYFAVYDEVKRDLIYTIYNFNFDKYMTEFKIDKSTDKNAVFYNFIIRNGHTFDKKFFVRDELKKYFNQIDKNMINYFNKYGYSKQENYMWGEVPSNFVSQEEYIKTQFELIPYDNQQLRRLQDYIYIDKNGEYTKYNFDFNTYSADYNVWGNKLVVFTDFVIRTTYLNDIFISSYGYGYPLEVFRKYFIQDPSLGNYLKSFAVTSTYANVDKSFPTIDFKKYQAANTDLVNFDNDTLIEHFYLHGQFERRPIPFVKMINPLDKITGCVATIITETGSASGFLFNGGSEYDVVEGKTQLYIVTCYHLFENTLNKNVMKVLISYDDGTLEYGESKTLKLEFKTVGYDIFTDICVGVYDPELDYNKVFNANLNVDLIPKLKIYNEEKIQLGDMICTVGNISTDDNLSYLEGTVIDPNFIGTFTDTFILGMPGSVLAEIHGAKGMSGSPIFVKKGTEYRCCGMINSDIGNDNQYIVGINGFMMNLVVNNIISRWYVFRPLYTANLKLLNFFIKDGLPKKWFGTKTSYFHQKITPSKFKAFSNFNYNGGLVLEDFILGFNYINKTFIYDTLELSKQGAIEFNTPLLNTKMYDRFIFSSRTPIVIKSVYYFENIHSNISKYYFGKYGNQVGLEIITYGLGQISTVLNEPGYTNRVRRQYPIVEFEYYYYNGNEWLLDKEKVGGNTSDWYNITTDPLGNKFYEHKFDVPSVLIPYIDVYAQTFAKSISTMGVNTLGRNTLGVNTLGVNTLGSCTLGGCTLGGCTLGSCTLGSCTLGKCTLGGCTLGGCTLGGCTLGVGTLGVGTLSQIKK